MQHANYNEYNFNLLHEIGTPTDFVNVSQQIELATPFCECANVTRVLTSMCYVACKLLQ